MIIKYQKEVTEYTTHKLNEPRDLQGNSLSTELCEIDGETYVSVPDGVALPPQPAEITVVPVVLTDALREQIKAASPHVRLINQRVVDQIRDKYSPDDEVKLLTRPMSISGKEYSAHVGTCRAWGADEKERLGLGLTTDQVVDKIKSIRSLALDGFVKGPGVSRVYDVNYEAALLGANDTTTILCTGKTPAQHLSTKGGLLRSDLSPSGMSGGEFAEYIIKENRGPAPYTAGAAKADEIEDEYLRLCGGSIVPTEPDAIAYQAFCDARTS
jgi:hypothetical protein